MCKQCIKEITHCLIISYNNHNFAKNITQMKRKRRFYCFVYKGMKNIGRLTHPLFKGDFGCDGDSADMPKDICLKLYDGEYAPFMTSPNLARFVNEELRDLILSFLPEDHIVQFIPVNVDGGEYGNKVYYLVYHPHLVCDDIIDYEYSKKLPDGSIVVPAIKSEIAKDLHFFNSPVYYNSIIVSGELMREMKKRNLHTNVQFWEWRSI